MQFDSHLYLDIFDRPVWETETWEERIENLLRHKNVFRYRVKTIRAGKLLECEIFPIWNTRGGAQRAKKARVSRPAQMDLNDKNAKKKIVRLTNHNFDEQDLWVTLTYDDVHLPDSPEQAKRDIVNYLRRIEYRHKKRGLPPLRYIYVTEFRAAGAEGGAIRYHHHLIMSGDMDRDEVESLWRCGARREAHRLQPDEFGLTGLALYIAKAKPGKKRWGYSRNLKMPVPTVSDRKITKRKAGKIAADENRAPGIFEKLYPGYVFCDMTAKRNDFVAGAYIYVRMRKQEKLRSRRRTGG